MRKSLTMLLSGAALAALAGTTASAQIYGQPGYGQPGYGQPTATLYELPNFQGRSILIQGENGNLDGVSFNDRARSARFEGAWSVCADANFRGHCETVTGAVAYLPPRLNASASSLRVSGGWSGGWPGQVPGQVPGWGGGQDTAILYELPNFQGRSITVNRENGNLDGVGFNDRARSAHLQGSWRICEDSGYRGRCQTVTGSVPNLASHGILGLSSLQMTSGGYDVPPYGGGYGQGVEGRAVVFYPGPVASQTYGGGYGVTRRAAEDFCRSMGHRTQVYYDTASGVLSDVLCRR
jgi:hypothetical protein